MAAALELFNGERAPLREVPLLAWVEFKDLLLAGVARGERLGALFAHPDGVGHRLTAVLVRGDQGVLALAQARVEGAFDSLTPQCPQAHLFEREVHETWGLTPVGHPWLKPVRFPGAARAGRFEAYRVEGEQVHEVAVGPVHAGVIEPGHFRFQCHGERVLNLEISLGYQHRGAEAMLLSAGPARAAALAETLAGDTSVGHATAYAQALEALAGCPVPPRAEALRAAALELERLANHVGDLGALAGDVGYLPTANYCGRLRGDLLNLTALLCGSRFGRGLVRPGGVAFDAGGPLVARVLERLEAALKDIAGAVGLLWGTPSVMGRFEGTGTLSRPDCEALGVVGVAARACGLERDARLELPSGLFRFAQVPVSTWESGDVFARAWVRWLEVGRSAHFVRETLSALPAGPVRAEVGGLAAESVAVALVEGWRGELCHVALTDGAGGLAAYKVVDPSFHNWAGLAQALRGQEISDFPLCNKSFNLSYCGHDL